MHVDHFVHPAVYARAKHSSQGLKDQFFYYGEKRLARTLLLLARHGKTGQTHKILTKVSQKVLAERK